MRVSDSVVLITGGSQGLGLAIAREAAARGARLILTARGTGALDDAAGELRKQTEVLALPGDVADEAHVDRLIRAGLDRFGRIDVLVNNASTLGASPMPSLEAFPAAALARVFTVNVLAPLHLIQRVLPSMRSRKAGLIINVTSDAGVQAYPGWGGYGASKAALEHLSRILAAELEGTGIRVLVVDPGDMDTQMHRDAEPGVDLSHLPGPEVSAPAFIQLIEEEPGPFARVEAQSIVKGRDKARA